MLRILCILIMLVITFRNWCVKKIVGFCKNYVKENFACLYLMTLVYLIICGWCLQASSKAQAIKVVCI